jgi:hypothetical protein
MIGMMGKREGLVLGFDASSRRQLPPARGFQSGRFSTRERDIMLCGGSQLQHVLRYVLSRLLLGIIIIFLSN